MEFTELTIHLKLALSDNKPFTGIRLNAEESAKAFETAATLWCDYKSLQ